jgi:hypothetical protein
MRTRRVQIIFSAALVLTLAACSRNECVERGTSRTFSGSASYDGQITSPAGGSTQLAGATTNATIVMDDFDPFDTGSCDEQNIEFTVRFDQCVLVAETTSDNHDTGKKSNGAFLGATAAVVKSLGCTLNINEGAAALTVQSGTLQVGESSVELTVAGDVTSIDGASSVGQIQWSFTGQP